MRPALSYEDKFAELSEFEKYFTKPKECFKLTNVMKPNFQDFGMIKSTFALTKDQKSFNITKFRELKSRDKEGREVVTYE